MLTAKSSNVRGWPRMADARLPPAATWSRASSTADRTRPACWRASVSNASSNGTPTASSVASSRSSVVVWDRDEAARRRVAVGGRKSATSADD